MVTLVRSSTLRQRWQAGSAATVWLDPADWWGPAVDAVVDALTAHRDATSAARELGRDRAVNGIDLEQARGDLEVAAGVAGLNTVQRMALVDGLTLAWIDERLRIERATACLDPLTGLATPMYLAARLNEIAAETAADASTEAPPPGAAGRSPWALVGVRVEPCADPWLREARMIGVQQALASAFRSGQTAARTGPWTAAVLTRRDPTELTDRLAILGLELGQRHASGSLPQAHVWVETIPGTPLGIQTLLEQFAL